MKRNKIIIAAALFATITSCKKDLPTENPNGPNPNSLNSETGIASFATGGIYINGFRDVKYTDGVFGPFFSGALGFHELMGDVIGCDAANAFMNQIGCPEKVTPDSGSPFLNPNSPNTQRGLITQINANSSAGNNTLYYEWAYMYSLINACNLLLEKVDGVSYSGDAVSKKAAIKAWAYWWKGYAYSRIGSTYYAGLVNNSSQGTSSNYVSSAAIITESNATLDKAVAAANAAVSPTVFTATLAKIIPGDFQQGKGNPVTPAMLLRNVNTLKARNLLVNKLASAMTAADWSSLTTLVNGGILPGDNVFTVRTDVAGNLYTDAQFVTGRTSSNSPGARTYKLSERWVQEFYPGDKRKDQNVLQGTPYIAQSDRGNAHFTRFSLVDGGTGLSGVTILANSGVSALEVYPAGTYEENELMKAEALINGTPAQVDAGLAIIDNVRMVQGAGLANVSGTGLTQAQAREQLRRERRVVLAFRGISFYDARRWGITKSIANGGGRTGCTWLSPGNVVSTNATIEYNYLDYWHVPGNELTYNPAASGSAPVVNPN